MKRKYFWGILVILVLIAAVYIYKEYNRTTADVKRLEPNFRTEAVTLIKEFEQNESEAQKKYSGLNIVLSVKGFLKGIEMEGTNYTLLLGDTASMSSVRCRMDSAYVADAKNLAKGNQVTINGYFNGYKSDDTGMLGSDVELNRCVIMDKKVNN
jgi:hypothetical protein